MEGGVVGDVVEDAAENEEICAFVDWAGGGCG